MAELTKRNALSWGCERGFYVGHLCTVVIVALLFAMFRLQLIAINVQPLLVWIVFLLLSYIILFAGMKIGGIFAAAVGAMIYQAFFFSFVVLMMVVPKMEISISLIYFLNVI